MHKYTPIMNQALPYRPEPALPMQNPCVVFLEPKPSRFRRKKGYAGRTAGYFNGNYKSMPEDF